MKCYNVTFDEKAVQTAQQLAFSAKPIRATPTMARHLPATWESPKVYGWSDWPAARLRGRSYGVGMTMHERLKFQETT